MTSPQRCSAGSRELFHCWFRTTEIGEILSSFPIPSGPFGSLQFMVPTVNGCFAALISRSFPNLPHSSAGPFLSRRSRRVYSFAPGAIVTKTKQTGCFAVYSLSSWVLVENSRWLSYCPPGEWENNSFMPNDSGLRPTFHIHRTVSWEQCKRNHHVHPKNSTHVYMQCTRGVRSVRLRLPQTA